jgi:hypothetical protein
MAAVIRQAGQRTHRKQWFVSSAASIVGANSIGMRIDCRSFQSATRRLASSTICGPSARRDFGFLRRGGGALALHLALVEAHGPVS